MTIRRRIAAVEGEPIILEPPLRDALRQTGFRLRRELKLSFPPIEEDETGLKIRNLVGAIDIGGGILIDVEPKTRPGENWVRSVLSLLIGEDPVDAAGERSSGRAAPRPDLLEAIAAIYAARLERALRRDGPLATMQRVSDTSSVLKGRLDVGRWIGGLVSQPTRFPLSFSTLAIDNDYTRALAYVCLKLGRLSRRPVTRARLLQLAGLLRPGLPDPAGPAPGVEQRRLPSQWAVYQPAWSIACAILARRSLLGPEGHDAGVSVAIEPWPLLERLLERSIASAIRQGNGAGRALATAPKVMRPLLQRVSGAGAASRDVEPDGLLLEGGSVVASFEAKYRDYKPSDGPQRAEMYQALAAARAVSSGLAVLIYPGTFEMESWSVEGDGTSPVKLVAVGLEMFSYTRAGDDARGAKILAALGA